MAEGQVDSHLLDWQEGIARVVNNKALYCKLLGRFAESQADAPQQVADALAAGDAEQARLVAHTLKGTAANLSAHALMDAALVLETAVKNGEDATAALENTRQVLAQTLDAMEKFRQS